MGRERAALPVQQRSRHPEVNQMYATALEPKNQILAATVDSDRPLAAELRSDLRGIKRLRQTGIEDLDVVEAATDNVRLQLGTYRLDLWQLRHVRTLDARRLSEGCRG